MAALNAYSLMPFYGPSPAVAPVQQIDGRTKYVGDGANKLSGAVKAAASSAFGAVFAPFNVLSPAAEVVSTETKRVGESARLALTGTTSGLKTGATIAALVLVLLVGLWALSTARKIAGGS